MKKPLSQPIQLSVVTIAFDSEKTLDRTLQSIENQKFDSMEVICVDDGSTDGTFQIMERWSHRDSRFKTIRHPSSKGIHASRYDGLMAAQGEMLLFMDSDGIFLPGAFHKLCQRMQETGADVCEFGIKLHFPKGHTLSKAQITKLNERYHLEEQSFQSPEELLNACFVEDKIKVCVWNKLYRTRLVRKAFEGCQNEWTVTETDSLFSFMVLSLVRKYDCFPEKAICHSVGGDISTGSSPNSGSSPIRQASALRLLRIITRYAETIGLSSMEISPVLDAIRFKLTRKVVNAFVNSCDPSGCQLFLDTALQYCSINDFLITFSTMVSKEDKANTEDAVNKLRMCRMPTREAQNYVNNFPTLLRITDPEEIERYYRSTITWRIGNAITWLPRKLRNFLIRKKVLTPREDALKQQKVPIPEFKPRIGLPDCHHFLAFATIVEEAGGCLENREDFLKLEYERGIKLLLVTDDAQGKLSQRTVDTCLGHGIHLTILSLTPEKKRDHPPEKGVTVISISSLEQLSLSRFADLFDGLLIDTKDYFPTIEQMRSSNRNTLILTNTSIVVGLREKYCLRKEYDLEKYLDWLVYGSYLLTDDVISVIVPTYNAGEEFESFLCAIEQQHHIQKPEIIVIDSGSTDGTLEIAKRHQVRLYSIPQKDFSHSGVRNMGADLATGKYLLFTTQDAFPSSCLTYCRLLQKLLVNHVAAVSAAEECRPDADLYAKINIVYYKYDCFICSPGEIKTLKKSVDYVTDRLTTCLDDVMCMTERDIFRQFRYRYSFAEDCDYGLRLALAGYSIGRTDETKVIHSHNRRSDYFLERSVVDVCAMKTIYPNMPVPEEDVQTLAGRAITLYVLVMLQSREMLRQFSAFPEMTLEQMQAFAAECLKQAEAILRALPMLGQLDFSLFPKEIANKRVTELLKQILPVVSQCRPVLSDLPDLKEYIRQIVWLQSLESKSFAEKEILEVCTCLEKFAASRAGADFGVYELNWKGSCPEMDKAMDTLKLHI